MRTRNRRVPRARAAVKKNGVSGVSMGSARPAASCEPTRAIHALRFTELIVNTMGRTPMPVCVPFTHPKNLVTQSSLRKFFY